MIELGLLFFVGLFWFAVSLAVASYASKKGYSWFGFFLLAIFISPVIAGIIVLIIQPTQSKIAASSSTRKCPRCAEEVAWAASLCKHCGSELTPEKDPAVLAEAKREQAAKGIFDSLIDCPNCKVLNRPGTAHCTFCATQLAPKG
jgi:hypothetical protein